MSNIGLNTFEVEQCVACTNCFERTLSRRHEFTEIIVPVLHDWDNISLQNEVDRVTRYPDLIEGGTPCDKCHNIGLRVTQKEMKTVPQFLMFVMQRNQGRGKMLAPVEPPDEIVMTYSGGAGNTEKTCLFQLKSVVVHKGDTCDQGHYVTMVREPAAESGWIICDDHIIETARPEDISAVYDQCYMIIYERMAVVRTDTGDSTNRQIPVPGSGTEFSTSEQQFFHTTTPTERADHKKRQRRKCKKRKESAMRDDVIEAIKLNCRKKPNAVMRQVNKIAIKYRDMQTLLGRNWLNDVIINGYLEMIDLKSRNDDGQPRIYPFFSQWYQQVNSRGETSLRRMARLIDLAECDWLLFPVNTGVHWYLIAINPKEKMVVSLDSLQGDNATEIVLAVQVVRSLWKEKYGLSFDCQMMVVPTPRQHNSDDCGVYLCYFAYYLSVEKDVRRMRDIDSKKYRHTMIHNLYRGSFTC
ncbi:uncharacterized protein LOC105447491 [Strongylocentrotus purpuratus]|uniref:Ubiquitin-like protease family profile domain-containing protein n=1 Tax=Strongylocentrotus purpuratus TaxID=7668 RepID=A0A7M7T5D3_STRPU|nr:uncharacterized protein LOC105447491 [Strongylocentrotus purpuratus]